MKQPLPDPSIKGTISDDVLKECAKEYRQLNKNYDLDDEKLSYFGYRERSIKEVFLLSN